MPLREDNEGERKLGDPGFIFLYVEEITFTHHTVSEHPKGYGGHDEPLDHPEQVIRFVGGAKWHNTRYQPGTNFVGIEGNSLREIASLILRKQRETEVTDQTRYTYSFNHDSDGKKTEIGRDGKQGTQITRALNPDELKQLFGMLGIKQMHDIVGGRNQAASGARHVLKPPPPRPKHPSVRRPKPPGASGGTSAGNRPRPTPPPPPPPGK